MRAKANKAVAHIQTRDAAADWSMNGKTVLFTGASRGMGRFAAIELAQLGAEILVVGHNEARGAAAVEAIRGVGGSAAFLRADIGDAAVVCALANAVLARNGSIDVLIHSAGGLLPASAHPRGRRPGLRAELSRRVPAHVPPREAPPRQRASAGDRGGVGGAQAVE
jgi:NAD(P)-dependent dehydrogenase (short-subunit alcohol dehydrogenase family)